MNSIYTWLGVVFLGLVIPGGGLILMYLAYRNITELFNKEKKNG